MTANIQKKIEPFGKPSPGEKTFWQISVCVFQMAETILYMSFFLPFPTYCYYHFNGYAIFNNNDT